MDLLLLPQPSNGTLADVYHRALRNSVRLYIVSAYLTHWEIEEDLGPQCETFVFIVGKDFGITRKAACENVLDWLPEDREVQFLAAEGIDGFHPKAVFWQEADGSCHCLLGSSNLSRAAFTSNYEANGYAKISSKSFAQATEWITRLMRKCVTLDSTWLDQYREALQPRKPRKPDEPAVDEPDDGRAFDLNLPLPLSAKRQKDVLARRREQIEMFSRAKNDLVDLFSKAKRARVWQLDRNEEFYWALKELWSYEAGNRFQGAGWERQGKSSDFREFARSLIKVMEAEELSRDAVVSREIDRLKTLDVRTRGALFSEMLCQFFPEDYYVLNKPVKKWLRGTTVSAIRGDSEGSKYIRGARLLRTALARSPKYPAKNLAELDALIWLNSNPESTF